MPIIALLLVLLAPPAVWGYETAGQTKIAVVNWDLVEKQSDAWQSFIKKLNEEVVAFQAGIRQSEADIRAREEELLKQKNSIKKEDYQRIQSQIQKDTINLGKQVESKKRQLDEVYRIALQYIQENTQNIARELAQKYKIDLILNSQTSRQVMVLREKLEITGEILNLLNYKIKEIPWVDPNSIKIKDIEIKSAVPLTIPLNKIGQ